MNANELMIGDYVRFKRTKEIVWVFEIDGDRHVINNEMDGYCSEKNIAIDDVEPIPLTPEILEKNGFGYVEHEQLLHHERYYIGKPHVCMCSRFHIGRNTTKEIYNVIDMNGYEVRGLRYVHELQHALRLCGISKDIELQAMEE